MDLLQEFDIEFEDITEKLGQLAEYLSQEDQPNLLCSHEYQLKDSLADIEACDPRTDAKCNIDQTFLANRKIEEK